MSHTSTAEINAKKIECEELLKQARKLVANYNFNDAVVQKIEQQYRLKEIENTLANNKELTEGFYRDVYFQTERLNNFISNIETYLVMNLDINAINYNKKISELADQFILNDQSILEEALNGVESNIKRKYILSRFNSNRYKSSKDLLKDVEEDLKGSAIYQNELIEANMKKLAEIKKIDIKENTNVNESIKEANKAKADEEVSINVRNRVVTAIIKIIREQGFIVKRENVVTKGDEAIILASKPNGEEARFKVHLNGKFAYKFHKYEGLSCEKDINNFESLFESVYGIKLEEKNVIWTNPDRLDKMAHQTMNNNKIGG